MSLFNSFHQLQKKQQSLSNLIKLQKDSQTIQNDILSVYQVSSQQFQYMIINSQQSDMALFETFYIQYAPEYRQQVNNVLAEIQRTYATFRYFQLHDDLSKHMNQTYADIKLTKRKKTFAVLAPINSQENPESIPAGCKKILVTNCPDNKDNIFVSKDTNWEDIETELVYRLQLDSIWVGLLCRIGTSIQELVTHLVEYEHFESFKVRLIKHFYNSLESRLLKGEPFSLELLKECKRELDDKLQEANTKVEELVRSKFNRRMVVTDISAHPYINLLESRSYFNLILIQEQILTRFENFKNIMKDDYPHIHRNLNLTTFILLDDYLYSEYIFGCLKKVTKYINRTTEVESYSEIVRKYHKDIIREFRPSVHEYFLNICLVLKERAACLKQAVGSIIVRDRSIISSGYNGTPMGTINCYNGGCQVCNNSQKMGTQVLSCRCIHAEYNCILTAGITETPGAILYSTKIPCLWCAKLIIQGRIKEVIYLKSKYQSLDHDNMALVKKTFKAGGVTLREMELHNKN